MKAKPPLERRKFANDWEEVDHLYQKLLYWLYERQDRVKAAAYAERLMRLLNDVDATQESIFGQECRSLIYETRGDLPKAIEHRENEIRLMRRLHEISCPPTSGDVVLKGCGHDDLSDRLDLLSTLYHDSGNLDRAIAILHESKQLCEAHGIEFDGSDILDEYLVEKNASQES